MNINKVDLRIFRFCAATVCDSVFAVSFRCIAAWAFWIAPALIPAPMRFWWTLQPGLETDFQPLRCSSWTTLTLDWYDKCDDDHCSRCWRPTFATRNTGRMPGKGAPNCTMEPTVTLVIMVRGFNMFQRVSTFWQVGVLQSLPCLFAFLPSAFISFHHCPQQPWADLKFEE